MNSPRTFDHFHGEKSVAGVTLLSCIQSSVRPPVLENRQVRKCITMSKHNKLNGALR